MSSDISLRLEVDEEAFRQIDRVLSEIEPTLRAKFLEDKFKEAMEPMVSQAKSLIPIREKPPGKNKNAHLRRAVKSKTIHFDESTIIVGMVGWDWKIAPHGFLVEEGHKKVLWGRITDERVEGKKYLATAVADTQAEVQSRLLDSITTVLVEPLRDAGLMQ